LDKLLLDHSKSLSETEKLNFVKGIARGMLHLHNHNIIHRDLAARNILLSETGEPKISVSLSLSLFILFSISISFHLHVCLCVDKLFVEMSCKCD
jgi:serine/threonine protein kinase